MKSKVRAVEGLFDQGNAKSSPATRETEACSVETLQSLLYITPWLQDIVRFHYSYNLKERLGGLDSESG